MELKGNDKIYDSPDGQDTLLVVPMGRFYAAYSTRLKKKCVYFAGQVVCAPADTDELVRAVRTLNQAIGEMTPKSLNKELPKDYS